MDLKRWGPYVFLLGFVIALIVGIAGQNLSEASKTSVLGILALLGLVVGLVNVADKEVIPFLIAVVALLQVGTALSALQTLPVLVDTNLVAIVTEIVAAIVTFMTPAALVVALVTIYKLAGEKAFAVVEEDAQTLKKKR